MLQDWVRDHYELLSVATSLGTLAVWLAYLQLFFAGYRRQRRPNILIGRSGGRDLRARCLLSNMSVEAIYVTSIIATLESGDDRWRCPVADGELPDDERLDDPLRTSRQGPLASGASRDIGSFQSFVERVQQVNGAPARLQGHENLVLQLQVIAEYTAETLPVGATRRFDLVKEDGAWVVSPESLVTRQARSRAERRTFEDVLKADT